MQNAHARSEHSSWRASRVVLCANISLMSIQVATGWLTGSHAIVADGVHTLVDLAIDAVLFASLHRKGASASWLPAAFIATLLTLTGMELLWQGATEASNSNGDAATIAQICAVLVALTAVVTRECVARHLNAVSSEIDDTHAHAAGLLSAGAWHARIDAISAGAAAVGALGTLAGLAHLDQLATLVIGGMMLWMGLLHEGSLIRLSYRFVKA
jgi:divalent metal cation (Fe/Co/Zn/Cd) transporter